jgi:hypothetical protein
MARLEKVTQQNAAMVEEASAAAVSLEDQSRVLTSAVSAFRLSEERDTTAPQPEAARAEKPLAAQPTPAPREQAQASDRAPAKRARDGQRHRQSARAAQAAPI